MPDLNDHLIKAYLETHYRVGVGPACFTLRIGVPNGTLKARNRDQMFRQGIFITACNPLSELVSAEENADAQVSLSGQFWGMKVRLTQAVAVDPQELFPDEPGYFVEGASKEDGLYLALRYRQHGFVWVDFDDAPQLVLLRHEVSRASMQKALDKIVWEFNGKQAPRTKIDHCGRPLPIWSHDRKGECEALEEVLSEFQGSEAMRFFDWLHQRCISVAESRAGVSTEYVCRYEDELAMLKKVQREVLALFAVARPGPLKDGPMPDPVLTKPV